VLVISPPGILSAAAGLHAATLMGKCLGLGGSGGGPFKRSGRLAGIESAQVGVRGSAVPVSVRSTAEPERGRGVGGTAPPLGAGCAGRLQGWPTTSSVRVPFSEELRPERSTGVLSNDGVLLKPPGTRKDVSGTSSPRKMRQIEIICPVS